MMVIFLLPRATFRPGEAPVCLKSQHFININIINMSGRVQAVSGDREGGKVRQKQWLV